MALAEVLVKIGVDITEVGKNLDKVEKRFTELGKAGERMAKVGQFMTKVFTLPLLGLGAAAFAAATSVEDAMNTIRAGTGATGKALENLGKDFQAVWRLVPQGARETATAIADLNTRLGLTGKPLRQLSVQLLELADLTRTQVAPLIATTTRLFGDWGIATEQQTGALDLLWKVSQSTGVQVQRLSDVLVQFGAPLRMMGFSLKESAALVGKWEKEGVNMELVLGSLRIAMGHFAREGVPMRQGLDRTMRRIQQLGPSAQATALAMEVFGARAGPDMAAAVLEGRFATEELLAAIRASPETIMKAGDATETLGEQLRKLRNRVSAAVDPIGVGLVRGMKQLVPMLKRVVDVIGAVAKAFSRLPLVIQMTAWGMAGLLALFGPALVIIGKIPLVIAAVTKGLLILKAAMAAVKVKLIALLSLLGPKGWLVLAGSLTIAVATFNRFRRVTAESTEALAEAVSAQNTLTQTGAAAAKGQEVLGAALEEAGKTAGKSIMSFDQVHQLQEDMADAEELAAKISPPLDLAAIKQATAAIEVPSLDLEIQPVVDTAAMEGAWDRVLGLWNNFRARAADIWERIYSAVVEPVKRARDWLVGAWAAIKDTAMGVFSTFRDSTAGLWESIRLAVSQPIERVRDWLVGAWTAIRDTAATAFATLRDGTTALWESIRLAVSQPIERVRDWLVGTWAAIRDTAVTTFMTLWGRVVEIWESIRLAVSQPIERVRDWLAGTWATIKDTVATAFATLRDRTTELWDSIRLAVSQPIERVRDWLANTWTAIRDTAVTAFQSLRDRVLGVWQGLEAGIRGVVDGILGPINNIVTAVREAISWLGELAGRRAAVGTAPPSPPPPLPSAPPLMNGEGAKLETSLALAVAPTVRAGTGTAQAAVATAAAVTQPIVQAAAQAAQAVTQPIVQAAAQAVATTAQAIVRPVQQAQRQVQQTANRIATAIVQPVQQAATRAAQAATTTAQAIVAPIRVAQTQIRRSTESIRADLGQLDPTVHESPSLVDNVRIGVAAIQREYRQLERVRWPQAAQLGVGRVTTAAPGMRFGGDSADAIADAVGNAVLFAMREATREQGSRERQQEVVLEVDGARLGRALLTGLRREEDRIGTRLAVT